MNENTIDLWVDSIGSMPEKQFFNMMRLYLGEIKTPYNKQRLTQQLAVFIKKPDTVKNLISLLDDFDLKVLTAISLLSNVTQENLTEFFSNTYTLSEIYSKIVNLKERLIIYTTKHAVTNKDIIYINPLLLESLKPYLDVKLLFPKETIISFSTEDVFTLTPNFLTAFISFLRIRKLLCKADGKLKKNDINKLEEIFPGRIDCIQLLVTAFINLSLVVEEPKFLRIDENHMNAFASLNFKQQCAFLCAASVSRFSREGLRKEAQLLLDCINSIPESGYTTQTILWLAYLAGTYTSDGNAVAKQGRFSQMLQAARIVQEENNTNAALLDCMIDSAITFGLLQKIGTNENGDNLYIPGSLPDFSPADAENQKVLNIDSTFTVSLMPGLPLSKLLPIASLMSIKKFGVVTEFELTKQSLSIAFDAGFNPEMIFEEIEKLSYYELPNNLKINIQEWYNSYSSAIIYQGFILKVTDNNIKLAENNPKIKKYLKEKLADGIYLLNIPLDANISDFKADSGLDFLGNVKTYSPEETFTSYPIIKNGNSIKTLEEMNKIEFNQISTENGKQLIEELTEALANKETDSHQKECLAHRINSRLILTKEQLEIAVIRSEILEADGMDFSGKVHLIDTALKEEDMLELRMPNADGQGFFEIIGKPLSMTKQPSEAILRFQIEPSGQVDNFFVSRITHIKRLRF